MAESLKITFGLKSSAGKYLTCESLMGGRVNASAGAMKNKQIWSFIPEGGSDRVVGYFLSSTGLYLSTLPDGKCCATSENGPAALFEVRAYPDGRWVLISKLGSQKEGAQEYFFGGNGENLDAFNKVVMVADPKLAPAPPPTACGLSSSLCTPKCAFATSTRRNTSTCKKMVPCSTPTKSSPGVMMPC
jgi:hypothetical protein